MPDFSHIKAMDAAPARTVEYKLYEIEANGVIPTLIVAQANEANLPYFNEVLKGTGRMARRVRGGALTASMVKENRDEDRRLFPLHVIKRWVEGTVVDADGTSVPFSRDNCKEFVEAIPDFAFDRLRGHCAETTNFLAPSEEEVDGEAMGEG